MKSFIGLLSSIALQFILTNSLFANMCVQADRANLRSAPSTTSSKTWEVYRFMPLQKVKEKNSWIQVRDVDGDTHWIQKKFVTNKIDCAVVREKEAKLRKGPSTKFGLVAGASAKKYYSYKILKRENQWLHVQDAKGGKAWVHRDSVWIQ